jgi:hypothetical protein
MKLIDSAVAHYSSQAVRSIEIPEWDAVLYAKNLTLDDKAKWLARSNSDTTDFMVYAVIFGIIDKEGEMVFSLEDKVKLRKSVDPEIVQRLANFVLSPGGGGEDPKKD